MNTINTMTKKKTLTSSALENLPKVSNVSAARTFGRLALLLLLFSTNVMAQASIQLGAWNTTTSFSEVQYAKINVSPVTPQNLTATAGNGQVTLRWNKNTESNFLRYRIFYGTSPSPTIVSDSTSGGVIDTIKTITGLTNGTTYYFRITAMDSTGLESDFRNEVSAAPEPPLFTQTVNNLGITSTNGQFGTGWADFDGDGDLDLLIVGAGKTHVLYRNDIGAFTDVSEVYGLTKTGITTFGNQPIWFDYDGDGKLDFLLAKGLYLFRQTDTGFVDVSASAGLGAPPLVDKESYWSAAIGDYDKDGDLDIAAAGGSQGASDLMGPLVILKNENSLFTNVTNEVFGSVLNLESWGITWVDFDNDGDLDLWAPTIRTPGEKNAMLINNQRVEFNYGTTDVFKADSLNDAMVSGWADYNNDGFMDLMTTPFNTTAGVSYNHEQFWRNNGDGTLNDIGPQLGFTSAPNARGLAWGDYDNDGDLDLLIGKRSPDTLELWRNDAGQFVNVATEAGVVTSCFTISRSTVC